MIISSDGPCPVGRTVSVWYSVYCSKCLFFFCHCCRLVSRHFFLVLCILIFLFFFCFRVRLNWIRFFFNFCLYCLSLSLDLQLCPVFYSVVIFWINFYRAQLYYHSRHIMLLLLLSVFCLLYLMFVVESSMVYQILQWTYLHPRRAPFA